MADITRRGLLGGLAGVVAAHGQAPNRARSFEERRVQELNDFNGSVITARGRVYVPTAEAMYGAVQDPFWGHTFTSGPILTSGDCDNYFVIGRGEGLLPDNPHKDADGELLSAETSNSMLINLLFREDSIHARRVDVERGVRSLEDSRALAFYFDNYSGGFPPSVRVDNITPNPLDRNAAQGSVAFDIYDPRAVDQIHNSGKLTHVQNAHQDFEFVRKDGLYVPVTTLRESELVDGAGRSMRRESNVELVMEDLLTTGFLFSAHANPWTTTEMRVVQPYSLERNGAVKNLHPIIEARVYRFERAHNSVFGNPSEEQRRALQVSEQPHLVARMQHAPNGDSNVMYLWRHNDETQFVGEKDSQGRTIEALTVFGQIGPDEAHRKVFDGIKVDNNPGNDVRRDAYLPRVAEAAGTSLPAVRARVADVLEKLNKPYFAANPAAGQRNRIYTP